ncbi:MAG: O-antigen ligase family protein [Firmicutes bacterium]|nr:O-antigen ligase family protein [Bacillota bacterium]
MNLKNRDTRWGFISPLSPALGLVYYLLLLTKFKEIWHGIKTNKATRAALLGLTIAGVLSALLSTNKVEGLLNMPIPIVFIFIYALARWGIQKPQEFLRALVLGCGVLGLIVVISSQLRLNIWWGSIPILARFTGRGNVLGMADNGLAAMMEAGVAGGIGLFLYETRYRWLYLLASVVSLLAIFATYSRGSMVAVLAAALLIFALDIKLVKRHWKLIVALGLLVVVVISQSPGLARRVSSITSAHDRSNIGRLQIYEVTWQMIKEHPLLGIGPGQYGNVYETYRPEGYLKARSPHNLYLFVLAGWGLVGFMLFFGWMANAVIYPLIKDNSPYRRIAFVMMISFWVHVLFNDIYIAHVPLIMGCIAHPKLGSKDTQNTESI